MSNKYVKILEEVLDEIKLSLEDPRGMQIHKRRLAFSLSLGASTLIESYFYNKEILKSGAKINHQWLNKSLDNLKEILSNQIICSMGELKELDSLLELAQKIEEKRNIIIYGKEFSEDLLKDLINLFFKLKEIVENA
jgi:hypothetical protein